MKLLSIEFSQLLFSARFITTGGTLFFPHIIRVLVDSYQFVSVPKTLEEFQSKQGISFKHGLHDGFVIDSFQIYPDGLLIQSKTNTERLENFLQELLLWIDNSYSIRPEGYPAPQMQFASHVVAELDVKFPEKLKAFSELGSQISGKLAEYGTEVGLYELGGIVMRADDSELGIKPSAFTVERRAGSPFASNYYFSTSPTKTDDHLFLLERFESLF